MYKHEVGAVTEGRSEAITPGQPDQGSQEPAVDVRQSLLDQARALLKLLDVSGADGRAEGRAPSLAALHGQLSGLSAGFREEENALAASWTLLRQQLACSQRPWRQAQKRLLRLAGGLLALAPRIDAVLARTARASEAVSRLITDITRNERHFTRNVASLAILRQQWDEAKALLKEGHQAMQKALAGHEPGSYARQQMLEESRLVLAPLGEVVRARRARLEIGRSRQRALSERIENFKDSLARETAAQHASAQLCRRLSKALSLLEQRLEMEERVVMAEGSRSLGLGQDQRKAFREGRTRVARFGKDLEAADALGQLLESSRQTLVEHLRKFTEAPPPPPVPAPGTRGRWRRWVRRFPCCTSS